jgi:heme A synthase
VFQVLASVDSSDLLYHKRSLVKLFHIVAAVILVLLLNLAALCIYRKYQKRKVNEELQLQVNSAVSQYFRLSGQETR